MNIELKNKDQIIDDIAKSISSFDRLPNNPDAETLKEKILYQLSNSGYITINVFACPTYQPEALLSNSPEEYILTDVKTPDLFTPRIKKLREIMVAIEKTGISSSLNILIGDSDPVDYVLPALSNYGVKVDLEKIKERSNLYKESFTKRVLSELDFNLEVTSLSDIDIPLIETRLANSEVEDEVKFLKWLFLDPGGPYKACFPLTDTDLRYIAIKKIQSYGSQGKIIESRGGILLQTETPWLLRTKMMKSGGANLSAIYPWIRKEEL